MPYMKRHGLGNWECEERVMSDLHFAERAVKAGDKYYRMGYRAEAKEHYDSAHRFLRRAIGTARSCTILGKIRDASRLLRRLTDVADDFEKFEERLEGDHHTA